MKLRGKKVHHAPVVSNYTKIPNELFGIKLNHVDKLVLMRLYYYPSDFVLAYTRLAQELSIGKTTIKESWKRLKQNGYIIEQGEYYIINLNGTGNDHKDIGTASGRKHDHGTGTDPTKVRDMDVLGSASGHTMVQEKTHIGAGEVPNEEETKEEEELNKTKEEPLVVGVGGVVSDSATHPFGVASSSPPPTQLSDENKSISKYTSNEDEYQILQVGYSEYLKRFPDSNVTYSNYEDLLMYTIHRIELESSHHEITNLHEIINILSHEGRAKIYNTHINNSLSYLKEDIDEQEKFKKLRQQLINSNQE
jgi:biotin operon repressor